MGTTGGMRAPKRNQRARRFAILARSAKWRDQQNIGNHFDGDGKLQASKEMPQPQGLAVF